jgi:type IV secretory pathway VirB2 component (pilin)
MPNYSLLLSAALLLTVATSPGAFAQGKPAAKKVIQIESMGARAFGGTTVPIIDC